MEKFHHFKSLLIKKSSIFCYNTRNKDQFRPPRSRLNIIGNSFFAKGITLWNLMDEETKNSFMGIYVFFMYIQLDIYSGNSMCKCKQVNMYLI